MWSRIMENVIEVCGVNKYFGEEHVLKDVSHTFEKGKIHGIVGNNGSGKTVLMKCICGFLKPDSGVIYVNHKQVGKETDFPEDIGIIIETPGFLPHLSGTQNLKILASLQKKANALTIRTVLEQVGLDPDMKKPVGKYSLGMRQRLGFAQALMEDPSLLILDEPLNGLDKHGVVHIRNVIKGLRAEGKTVILASHNQVDIDELCDTVCEMDAGVLTVVR
jgi:ABC-2 type transport system ATP-binding protein